MNKIYLDAVLICEGKYDKIKLSSIFDCLIIVTNGFCIFKNVEKLNLIKSMADKKDIIIVTDSDKAGFQIRNYIKNYIKSERVYNIFIPDVYGKEKRKKEASKEGKLGLEGLEVKLIISLFERFKNAKENLANKHQKNFDKPFLYEFGLIGKKNSYKKRCSLLEHLSLPVRMNTNTMVEVFNLLYDKEYIINLIGEIDL